MFSERFPNEEYTKHHTSTLVEGCKQFGAKTEYNCMFSSGAPTHNYEPGTSTFHKCGGKNEKQGRVSKFFLFLLHINSITISFDFFLEMRKGVYSTCRLHNL